MNVIEVIGMISTGALLTIGGMQLVKWMDDNPPPAAVTAAAQTPEPVTRAASRPTEIAAGNTVETLNRLVALSQTPLDRSQDLSPMQLEAIAFFERIARQQNESKRSDVGSGIRFANMAVQKLNVRYYSTVDRPYSALDRDALLDKQRELVRRNLCGSEAIVTLMKDYGFRYDYMYVSADGRFVGEVVGDAEMCA